MLFFPQRIELKLDGGDYSPPVLERIVAIGGACSSFAIAAKMFLLLTDLKVAPRTINNKTRQIGLELQADRDAQADAHASRPLTQKPNVAQPAVSLAAVQVDGGRMQTRDAQSSPGVHNPHWRESKNAGLYRMIGESYADDPHPQLPSCFSDKKQMKGLLAGLHLGDDQEETDQPKPDLSWRPEKLVRTCISSLCNSDRFGLLMSAEAERRGFYSAAKRAFLADGLAYNWKIQQQHFETFTPILDFIHPIERLYELARALHGNDHQESWEVYLKWIELCWAGDVDEVIGMLQAEQLEIGTPENETPDDDPRAKLAETLGYLRNNASRMDYPAYRTPGLPTSSCLIESQVKEMNHRVKGTEKFWEDGDGGEAILQVRAAIISDDEALRSHVANRPGNAYTRQTRRDRQLAKI